MAVLGGERVRQGLSKFLEPVSRSLRSGVSPKRLAWSLALGAVVGVNPLLGSTTVLALGLAMALRLNIVAAQVSNHLVYPLELLLFPVFIKLGSLVFDTPALPLAPHVIFDRAAHHPWELTKLLWRWEWHALVIWAGFACIAAPLLALLLHPVLERSLRRLTAKPANEVTAEIAPSQG